MEIIRLKYRAFLTGDHLNMRLSATAITLPKSKKIDVLDTLQIFVLLLIKRIFPRLLGQNQSRISTLVNLCIMCQLV
jgi:hypothetical protein